VQDRAPEPGHGAPSPAGGPPAGGTAPQDRGRKTGAAACDARRRARPAHPRAAEGQPLHGEGYRKVWARLRHAGVRTRLQRMLRVVREHRLLAHRRTCGARWPIERKRHRPPAATGREQTMNLQNAA